MLWTTTATTRDFQQLHVNSFERCVPCEFPCTSSTLHWTHRQMHSLVLDAQAINAIFEHVLAYFAIICTRLEWHMMKCFEFATEIDLNLVGSNLTVGFIPLQHLRTSMSSRIHCQLHSTIFTLTYTWNGFRTMMLLRERFPQVKQFNFAIVDW